MTDLSIPQLESFGHAVVARFGPLNVWTAALLGGAFVLDRALARRTRASWRIALYAPVALRILLPLDWSFSLPSAAPVTQFLAPLAQIGTRPTGDLSASTSFSWYAVAGLAYVAVAVLLAARALVARVRLGRALEGAQPATVRDAGAPCPVLQHDDLGPMAVGLLAPRIVLPRRLLAAGEEAALTCVLRHETAHLRRGDAWLSAAMQVLAVVAWPVAPLWVAMARVRQLIELACDESALAGADASERRRYGHVLLDIAAWRTFTVAPLGAGELHFGSTLRARIEALASQRHWPVAAQAIAVSSASVASVLLLLACGGASNAGAATPSSPKADDGYGYEFETDSAKAAATAPPSKPSVLNPDGRLSPENIQATVRSHFGAFHDCYEAGLKKDPKLTGTVVVKYVFGEDGVTKEAVDQNSTLPDKDVVGCVVGAFRTISYAKVKAGEVTVVYPLQFAPDR